ncbi:membrane hypothetical protein [Frankia canadensis]|uniref:Uncharacterized protein n=1 Tax=Frankia canadensis TaxID=1836972 RepID=A0A2I2KN65_9ACTN|nr:hypothetical protein [Frankia canadensis]SNQ47082.1 membrane hypothetical protein [Frankia canadensis]SOU54372.1 membrane hypothetical protein [Frankia canadensis]
MRTDPLNEAVAALGRSGGATPPVEQATAAALLSLALSTREIAGIIDAEPCPHARHRAGLLARMRADITHAGNRAVALLAVSLAAAGFTAAIWNPGRLGTLPAGFVCAALAAMLAAAAMFGFGLVAHQPAPGGVVDSDPGDEDTADAEISRLARAVDVQGQRTRAGLLLLTTATALICTAGIAAQLAR